MTDEANLLSDSMDMARLERDLSSAKDMESLKQAIVSAPFNQPLACADMFLAFVVLMLHNPKTGMIDRVSISQTELAHNTFEVTVVPFEDIKIPADCTNNIIVQAINSGEMRDTIDWYYTFTPALTGDQARINQASAGVTYTAIYPLYFGNNKGVLSFSFYQYEHTTNEREHDFMKQYARIVTDALKKIGK